ncbi:uncharacterized protein LOC128394103 [Panonychus citri]|uniref:uncharacterized protein LOC128394103 n=1 Tax=Panonychus citri TaxID=50023 RepID=UPI00230777E3|nr:uncharacterized protein LOC128394103 [Panonychus citri]
MLPILVATERIIQSDNNEQHQQSQSLQAHQQHHPASNHLYQPSNSQQQHQQASTSLSAIINERASSNYQTFNSDKYDIGYSDSDYPIKDDEITTYCTSKHPKINFFFFTSFYVVFLMFGAIIFLIIEQPREIESRDDLISVQESFLSKYPHVEVEDVKQLITVMLKAQQDGYYVPIVGDDLVISEESMNELTKSSDDKDTDKQPSSPSDETAQSPSPPNATTSKSTLRLRKPKPIDKSTSSSTSSSPILSLNATNEALVSYEIADDLENKTANNRSTIKLAPIRSITNWRFSSSLLFVTSLVTTIGYGNLTPLTVTGKITCIVFCIFGVPATLTFFSTLVTIFVRGPVKRLEAWLIRIIIYLHRSASVFTVRIIHLVIITSFLMVICLFIPAYFFYLNEDEWTYLESFYCCFISLTTIGLGDFVPGIEGPVADLLYPFVIVVYLFFGLSMIMVWLALIHRIPQLNLSDALVPDDKEEDKIAEEENAKNRERLRILTNQLILQHRLKKISSIRIEEPSSQIKNNQSLIP